MSFHCVRCHREIDRSFKACPHCGEPVTDFLREYADKPVDGKYRILERLGTGGMGEVYKVEHTFLGATRVIKVIRPQISGSDDAHDRFLREARLATKVQHANVATLHDFSALPDGSHYMVWEFIEGENIAQLLRYRGNLSPRYAVQLIRQALAGLEAVHRAGIVHRDLSPENVMLTRAENGDERIKIIDLGVAKGDETDQSMTKTGIFVGKLRYCSPEHLGFLGEGEKIDGRADLYSLAIVLYEMLSGRAPFEATSPHQYILHHSREEKLRSIDLNEVPGSAELQAILKRALERDRNKRYANAREFGDALAAVELTLPEADPWTDSEPLDGEPTLRLTPPVPSLPRTADQATVRTDAGAATKSVRVAPPMMLRTPPTTQRTDVRAVAPATVLPTPDPTAVVQERRRSTAPLITAVVVIVGLLAVIGYLMTRRSGATPDTRIAPATTAPAPARPSRTSFDVAASRTTTTGTATPPVSPAVVTASVAELTPPATTPTEPPPVQAARQKPPVLAAAVAARPAASPHTEPAPRQPETSAASAMTYTEKGDSTANDAATTAVQPQLQGTTRVALEGSGDPEQTKELTDALRNNGITVADGAPVAIHFNGSITHRGMGRKRRSAEATITKSGRILLHYTMPPEDYRVGDTPAEAFTRVLSELFK